MSSYGTFDDIPGYVDSSYEDGQALHGADPSASAGQPDAIAILRCVAVIVVVGLVTLWALGYWVKKG